MCVTSMMIAIAMCAISNHAIRVGGDATGSISPFFVLWNDSNQIINQAKS